MFYNRRMVSYNQPPPKGPPRVIRITSSVDRQIQWLVDDLGSPYETLSDFAEAAFRNHLELERADPEDHQAHAGMSSDAEEIGLTVDAGSSTPARSGSVFDGSTPVPELMVSITDVPTTAIGNIEASHQKHTHLSFLVNRLNPLPMICRSLARTAPQPFEGLLRALGEPARVVGFRLRADDAARGLPMANRLATSWPVGDDAAKSINKFVLAYVGDSAHPGALVQLSLAIWDDSNELRLTALGAELAKCSSPLVDNVETTHGRVSDEAIKILKKAIVANEAESDLVNAFLRAVEDHSGNQTQVDEELASRMNWSHDVAVSTRAALLGRLRDLGVVEVEGRGAKAVISTVDFKPLEGISPIWIGEES